MYYGIGVVDKVEGSVIHMRGKNDEILPLNHYECSVSMATQEGYEPKEGDAICWKGFIKDGEWIVSESLFFPAVE